MRHLVCTIEMDPVPKARPRVSYGLGGAHAYTPEKTKQAEALIRVKVLEKIAGSREWPASTPLVLSIGAHFEVPPSWPVAKQRAAVGGALRPASKGRNDWDNIGKLVADALTGVLWEDDGQIVDARVHKHYSDFGHIVVAVWDADGEPIGEAQWR